MDSSAAKELSALGAQIIEVDYEDASTPLVALEGVDVVISTLAGPGFGAQPALADAAGTAGVKLFVPSEVSFRFDLSCLLSSR